jgi:hypothetical protein
MGSRRCRGINREACGRESPDWTTEPVHHINFATPPPRYSIRARLTEKTAQTIAQVRAAVHRMTSLPAISLLIRRSVRTVQRIPSNPYPQARVQRWSGQFTQTLSLITSA